MAAGGNLFNSKQGFIVHSHSVSPSQHPAMTEILLKGKYNCKSSEILLKSKYNCKSSINRKKNLNTIKILRIGTDRS